MTLIYINLTAFILDHGQTEVKKCTKISGQPLPTKTEFDCHRPVLASPLQGGMVYVQPISGHMAHIHFNSTASHFRNNLLRYSYSSDQGLMLPTQKDRKFFCILSKFSVFCKFQQNFKIVFM
jgi:hypothetical protein